MCLNFWELSEAWDENPDACRCNSLINPSILLYSRLGPSPTNENIIIIVIVIYVTFWSCIWIQRIIILVIYVRWTIRHFTISLISASSACSFHRAYRLQQRLDHLDIFKVISCFLVSLFFIWYININGHKLDCCCCLKRYSLFNNYFIISCHKMWWQINKILK